MVFGREFDTFKRSLEVACSEDEMRRPTPHTQYP
jgi:hypothetical protein